MATDFAALFESVVGERCIEASVMPGSRTNVNARIRAAAGSYAMRVPGEGTNAYIDRHAEASNVRAVSCFDFTPDVVFADAESGILVTRFLEGAHSLSVGELLDEGSLARACAILARVHSSGIEFSNRFDLEDGLREYRGVLAGEGYGLPVEVVEAQPRLDAALRELKDGYSKAFVPSHGDPNAANFMASSERMYLIDWEYSGMADPYFDLANLVMTDSLDPENEIRVVRAYERALGARIDEGRWRLFKASLDYMWLYWHLIKLSQGQMVEYNEASWRRRLARALANLDEMGF